MNETQKKKVSKLKNPFLKNKKSEIDFNEIKPEEFKKVFSPEELKTYIEGQNIPKWTINYIVHLWKTEILKHSVILIRMILRNGKTHSFIINVEKPVFYFQKGAYIIDSSLIREDIGSGQTTLFFHQDLSLPIDLLKINIEQIKEKISKNENSDIVEVSENINPSVLKSTVTSTLIQQVMAGGLLDKQLKTITIILIINIVLSVIMILGAMINGFL